MKKYLLVLTLLIVSSAGLQAQITFASLPGPNGGGVGDIAINSSGNVFVYVAQPGPSTKPVAGTVYRSTNNGTNWTKLSGSGGLNDNDAYDIFIDASDNIYILGKTRIYKSTAASNGDVWTSFTPGSPFNGGSAIIKTTDGDLFVVNTFDGVLRSTDDGATWVNVSNNLPSPTNYSSIAAVGNDVFVGVLNSGTYTAVNPNSNSPVWNTSNSGLTTPNQPASFDLKGSTLYQTNRTGAYYLSGSTWTQIAQGTVVGPTYVPENFNNSDHVISNGNGTRLYLFFNNGHAYYSDNSTGGPWTSIANLNLGDNIYALKAFATSVFVGYGRYGLYRSTDSGTSFAFSDNGIHSAQASGYLQSGNRFIITNGSKYINVSDFGTNWSKNLVDALCANCSFTSIFKLSNGDLLAIGNETYRSLAASNGSIWTDIGGPSAYLQNTVTGNETNFYGYNYNGATTSYYKSTNGAVSFSAFAITGLPATYDPRDIAADASDNLYIHIYINSPTNKHELYKVASGSTAAVKITNTTLDNTMDKLRSFGGAIYMLGRTNGGIRTITKTTNGGTTWTPTAVTEMFDFIILSSEVFIGMDRIGSLNQFYYSNNAGVNWENAFTESDDTQLVGGSIDGNGYANIAITQGPMYQSENIIVRPVAPTNLQAVGTGENVVVLEWDHSEQFVEHFIIQRKLQSGGPFVTIDTVYNNDLYYRDSGLTKNVGYTYRVIASNAAGTNASVEINVTTKNTCALTIPDNRSWTGTVPGGFTNNSIAIKKLNDSGYQITDVTAGSLQSVAQNGGGTYGQTAVETFFYENCNQPFIEPSSSVFPNGNGSWNGTSLILNFQIDKDRYTQTEKTITLTLNANDPGPNAPQNLVGYVYNNSSIKIEWLSDFYHYKYLIHRSTTPAFTPTAGNKIAEVNYPTVSYQDNGPLTLGTTYYYQVIAQNANAVPMFSGSSNEAAVIFNRPQFIPSGTLVSNTQANTPTMSWADFDNDGLEDLILPSLEVTATSEPLLFRNTGTDFQLLTGKFPISQPYVTPSVGDYDNDGLIDIYMTTADVDDGSSSVTKYSLFKNTGNFNFVEQNIPVISTADPEGAFSSSWVDYNNDGKLDLFVLNQEKGKQALYQGDATGGFTKITTGALATDVFPNLYASWSDVDKNGFPDVLLATTDAVDLDNNGSDDVFDAFRLFTNNNGTFTKITGSTLDADDNQKPFTYSWGDYDNDLDMDLYAGNQTGPGLLYKNNGTGTFTKMAAAPNSPTENSGGDRTFGSAWGDIDNDGDLDLLVARGFFAGCALYRNDGATFTKITGELLTNSPAFNLTAAFADYNKDGFLDVVVGQLAFAEDGPAPTQPYLKLLKNNNTTGNWIEIKLVGTTSNKSAIGARIVVTTGAKTQMREITSHTGFGAQNSLIAHFGLGAASTIGSIQVTWPSGIVQNLSNVTINQILTITEDGTGPVFTNRSPINGAGSASTAFPVTIEVNESSTPVAAKKLNIYLASNLVTPVYSINVTAATKTVLSPGPGDRYSFTLPAKLLPNTDYTVSIDAGAFQDVFGNASLALTGWTFKTSTAPAVSLVVPAPNATSVAVNSALEITFSKNITAVAGKKIKVMNGATTVIDLDVFTNGTIATNKYTLPAPAGNWPFSSLLKVSVDPGAFIDVADQNDFAGIPTDSWNFTTAAAPDVTPPVITFSVPSTPVMKGFSPFNSPAITVTDNIGVTSVVVSIRKISGTTYTPVTATAGGTPNTYTIQFVESSHFDQIGTEFFITATDAAGNSSRGPDATGTYKIYLTYSDADSKIPATNIGVGGTKASWKVFSIPFELGSNNSVQSVFDELTQNAALKNKIDYRIITYKDQTTWAEFGNGDLTIFERGKGYFMNLLNPLAADIKIGANLTAPSNSRSNLFQMTLKQGWNMVGNPYLSPISWDDVKTLNALTGQGAQLVKYTGSGTGYSNNQSLGAYDGGFVFMAAAATVSIPFLGQTAVGGRKGFTELGTDINAEEWALPITLKQGEFSNELGAVGMAKDAHASFDDYDGITPPRFFDYLEMNFNHPEFFAHHFTRDVVSTQDNFTWEFSVDSNLEGQAELTWDNSPLSGSKDIFLLDISRQKLVNMKETGSYSFNPKESANFRVYFGDNLRIAPDKVHLGKAYPNPTSGLTLMAFSLPESGGLNQQVTLDIVDAMGREMGTITQGRFNPGYHEITWDAKELHNGFYTYRLTVQGKQGRAIEVNKLIIK